MDPRHFDDLARVVGSGTSRRTLLKELTAGVVGAAAAVLGFERGAAAAKRSVGNTCKLNSDCASNLCVQESRTRRICHCRSAADCPAATDACHAAPCLPSGYCGQSVNVGAPCNDGNACTTNDACQDDGSCQGTPRNCDDNNACTTDSCDPTTGNCVHTPVSCGASDACTTVTCDPAAGCVRTSVNCDDGDPCTTDTCDATLGCVHAPVECPVDEVCQRGVCTPIVTCDCANLNFCGGHGVCTAECTCVCMPPYTGPTCSDLPPVDCATFATCAECQTHASDGCVFCTLTTTSAADVCVSAADCLVPQVAC